MLKIAISSENFYKKIIKLGRIADFFEYRMDLINQVSSKELRNYIISRVKVENKTSKQTDYGRFSGLDAHVLELLSNHNSKVSFHDVAVSSGITSFELYKLLKESGIGFRLTVSDLYSVYEMAGGLLKRIYGASGTLKKAYLFGIVIDDQVKSRFFISKYLHRVLSKINFSGPGEREKLFLFDNQLLALIEQGDVRFVDYDIFETKIDEKYGYVRCMNILNNVYFSEEKIECGLKNIFESLEDGGIFQVGRTDSDNGNQVTFYRKSGQQLVPVRVYGGGSEISGIVARTVYS
jgi:chemotaxis methyl-accepting protein methylase